MTPCSCGADTDTGARYCSACGSALGEPFGPIGVSSVAATTVGTEGLDRRLLALAGLVLMVVIGWSVASGSSGGVDGGERPEGEAAVASTTLGSPATTAPPRRDSTTSITGSVARSLEPGGMLLGEETGLQLVMRASRHGFALLDLDTGVFVDGTGSDAPLDPIAVSGELLLARHYERLVSVPLDALDAEPITLLPNASTVDDDAGRGGEGLVWIAHQEGAYRTHVLIDAGNGSILDEIDYDQRTGPDIGVRALTAPGRPDLVGAVGGGVYEHVDARFVRVSDGSLLAADSSRVLVSICEPALACRHEWLSRTTWEPIDLLTPAEPIDAVSLGEGTDWLSIIDYEVFDTSARVLNVVTGDERVLRVVGFDPFAGPSATVSPDGRWMARLIDGRVELTDDLTGEVVMIELPEHLIGTVVFTTALAGAIDDRAVGG